MGSNPTLGSEFKMRKAYSRLRSVEERKNVHQIIFYVVLSMGVGVLLFFVGIPITGRITAYISTLRGGSGSITVKDTTPPPPPRFSAYSEYTNQPTVTILGSTEPGATVKLTFNGNDRDTLADKDGVFSFGLNLNDGENDFSAISVDPSGNKSQESKSGKIIFDNQSPDLNIDSPTDGAQFFGSQQRQITIQGTTEAGTQVTINDRIVVVDDSGKFSYTTSLTSGENKFDAKATDTAGNQTEKTITLTFSE